MGFGPKAFAFCPMPCLRHKYVLFWFQLWSIFLALTSQFQSNACFFLSWAEIELSVTARRCSFKQAERTINTGKTHEVKPRDTHDSQTRPRRTIRVVFKIITPTSESVLKSSQLPAVSVVWPTLSLSLSLLLSTSLPSIPDPLSRFETTVIAMHVSACPPECRRAKEKVEMPKLVAQGAAFNLLHAAWPAKDSSWQLRVYKRSCDRIQRAKSQRQETHPHMCQVTSPLAVWFAFFRGAPLCAPRFLDLRGPG